MQARGDAIARHRQTSDEDTTGSGRTATATAWQRNSGHDDATVELLTPLPPDDLDVPTRPARVTEGPTLELHGFTGFDEVLPGTPVGAANELTRQLVPGVTRTLPRAGSARPRPEPEATVPAAPASEQATIRTPVASPPRLPAVVRRPTPSPGGQRAGVATETKAGLLGLGVGTVLLLAVLGAVVLLYGA